MFDGLLLRVHSKSLRLYHHTVYDVMGKDCPDTRSAIRPTALRETFRSIRVIYSYSGCLSLLFRRYDSPITLRVYCSPQTAKLPLGIDI
jgi:hypothetical protein